MAEKFTFFWSCQKKVVLLRPICLNRHVFCVPNVGFLGSPKVNQHSVCFGESVAQHVALYKCIARSRASVSASAVR